MLNTGSTPKPKVRRGEGQTDYKRALAYQLLGVRPSEVQRIPFFAAQLRKIARCVRGAGGRPTEPVRALDFLESSGCPEARKVLQSCLSIPESYRRLLPPEAFCHAAGVSPWSVLEAVTVVAVRRGAMASAIIASLNHPRTVQKTVEIALRDDGFGERELLHRAMGFIPS
jgi:hypothetical protein